jgi:hypothetical protein
MTGAYILSYVGATIAGMLGLIALVALLFYRTRQRGTIPR